MDGRFLMGLLVGFLLGVITTVIAVFLFFVPVRRTTTPASLPAVTIETSVAPTDMAFAAFLG